MSTATRNQLASQLQEINRRLPRPAGDAYALDWAYRMPRLTRAAGSVDVGPRLPARVQTSWLDGFLAGIREAQQPPAPRGWACIEGGKP